MSPAKRILAAHNASARYSLINDMDRPARWSVEVAELARACVRRHAHDEIDAARLMFALGLLEVPR